MSTPFLRQIAQQLGTSEAEADAMLEMFVGYLEDELNRTGAAVIPGIGTFTRENGQTEFMADSELAQAVNFRNSGLEPVEVVVHGLDEDEDEELLEEDDVMSASETVPAVADVDMAEIVEDDLAEPDAPALPPDMADDEEFDFEMEEPLLEVEEEESVTEEPVAAEPDEFAREEDAPAAAESDDFGEEEVEEEVHVAPDLGAMPPQVGEDWMAQEPVEASHEDVPVPSAVLPVASEEETPEIHSETVPPPMTESTPPPPTEDRPAAPPARKRSGAPWLIVGLFVLILGIVGLFVLFSPGDREGGSDDPIAEIMPPVDEPGTDQEDPDPAVDELPDEEPAPTPDEPFDAVYGDRIDQTQSRYTLVIASLPSRGAAETVMNSWRNRGFRADVFAETIDGVTRYRVGVGQFDTIDHADAVRSEGDLAADLPEGTWVYRYPAAASN